MPWGILWVFEQVWYRGICVTWVCGRLRNGISGGYRVRDKWLEVIAGVWSVYRVLYAEIMKTVGQISGHCEGSQRKEQFRPEYRNDLQYGCRLGS